MSKKSKAAEKEVIEEQEVPKMEVNEEEAAVNDTEQEVEDSGETDELATLQEELAEAKDKYLRLYSEFDNFRRRTAKERLELMETANESLFLSLLPIVDDFERADKAFSEDADTTSMKEGIDLIYNKLINVLQQKGLSVMDTKEGSEFDPELHDAITQIPAPSKKLKGKIVDTIERGYCIGEKVIRHAKVVVGN